MPQFTTDAILAKTYYNVHGHQPESLDWFNVLVAQTIAQIRAEAEADDAILASLTEVLNGPGKPEWVDEIKITEISLGEEFPIFSNCRVIPVDEGVAGGPEGSLQARMDVDLSDVITLGVETKLVLNYPKPLVAVLPVALAVSVVRFSGTVSPLIFYDPTFAICHLSRTSTLILFLPSKLSLSFVPSSPNPSEASNAGYSSDSATHQDTTLTFTFLDDYRLDLSVRSLVGSRSRLQDVPKIAQLVESRLHAWFDERCVEPRVQQIVLPSLWPRKKNTRVDEEDEAVADDAVEGIARETEANSSNEEPGRHPQQQSMHAEEGMDRELRQRLAMEGEKIRRAEERAGSTGPGEGLKRRTHGQDVRKRAESALREDPFQMPGGMPETVIS